MSLYIKLIKDKLSFNQHFKHFILILRLKLFPGNLRYFATKSINIGHDDLAKKVVYYLFKKAKRDIAFLPDLLRLLPKYPELKESFTKEITPTIREAFIDNSILEQSPEFLLKMCDLENIKASKKFKSSFIEKVEKRLLPVMEVYSAACNNSKRSWGLEQSYFLIRHRKLLKLNKLPPKSELLSIKIPHFYFDCERTGLIEEIIEIFNFCTKDIIEKTNKYIYPELQYFTIFSQEPYAKYNFSYHSCGRDRNHLRLKESPLRGYYNIDTEGYSGWLSINNGETTWTKIRNADPKDIECNYLKLYNQFVTNSLSKYRQPKGKEDLPPNYIFLATQVVGDSVNQLANINVIELLKYVAEYVKENNVNLVIKRHPKCKSPVVEIELRKLQKNKNIHISTGNIHHLIKNSKFCVMVNSGVGLESLMHLKQVVTTGLSDYSICSHYATNKQELFKHLDLLNKGSNNKYSAIDIKSFLHYYFSNYLFNLDDKEKIVKRLTLFKEVN